VAASWQLVHQFRNLLLAAHRELPAERILGVHDPILLRVRALIGRGRRAGTFRTELSTDLGRSTADRACTYRSSTWRIAAATGTSANRSSRVRARGPRRGGASVTLVSNRICRRLASRHRKARTDGGHCDRCGKLSVEGVHRLVCQGGGLAAVPGQQHCQALTEDGVDP
jgi:hypothetical protein